jgi:hypothetical protein
MDERKEANKKPLIEGSSYPSGVGWSRWLGFTNGGLLRARRGFNSVIARPERAGQGRRTKRQRLMRNLGQSMTVAAGPASGPPPAV